MDDAVAGLKAMAGISWANAWEAGSLRPWELMRRADPDRVAPRRAGTFVVARLSAAKLEVVATVANRRVLWQRDSD